MTNVLHPNLATEKKIVDRVKAELLPQLKSVREDHQPMREKRMAYLSIFDNERTSRQGYRGRTQTYIGAGRRIAENWVQKLKRDLFPTDEWFAARALRASLEKKQPVIEAVQYYFMNKHARMRRHMSPWLRQLVSLGTSPIDQIWRLDERKLPVIEEAMNEAYEQPTDKKVKRLATALDYIGPTFRPVSLLSWYVWPYTVEDVHEAWLIFEEQIIPKARIEALGRKPLVEGKPSMGFVYENVKEALSEEGFADADKFNAEDRRVQSKGFKPLSEQEKPRKNLDLTKCFWRADLEKEDELNGYFVTIARDEVVLQVQKNPFIHGQSRWLAGKFIEVENEFYGRSVFELMDKLQYLMVDVADQSNDSLIWSLNPITVVDPFEVRDMSTVVHRPGARWLANPQGIQFAEPPKDTAAVGFQAVNQMIGLMEYLAGIAPFSAAGTQNRAKGRGLQTAAGMQMMLSESLVQVRDIIENIEDQVMVPWLTRSHSLTQQFLDRELFLRITGVEGAAAMDKKVSVEDISGEYDFMWLGSLHTMNQQVRGTQMNSFLATISQIPPEIFQAQNIEVDLKLLLRSIWSDGMGLRNAERIVRDKIPMTTIDPAIENDLFKVGRGREVEVRPADNDAEHVRSHQKCLSHPDLDNETKLEIVTHIRKHIASQIAKDMMQKQMGGPGGMMGGQPQGGPQGGNGAAPRPPGRVPATSGLDDLYRRAPRGVVQ